MPDRGLRQARHAAPAPDDASVAASASTWMQVVFGGISTSVAIAALVIAYLAWIRPHSPDGPPEPPAAAITTTTVTTIGATATAATAPPPVDATTTAAAAGQVGLTTLDPEIGGDKIRITGGNLAMPCASGQSSDRQRSVQYDLAGRYTAFTARIAVAKAPDSDSQLQMKIFADDRQATVHTLADGKSETAHVPLDGVSRMRIELTCQSRLSELTITEPRLDKRGTTR
ncbi:NPCBM/NEW2 domain-containing protein [Actinoplanes missouriensis]|uniref:NPCBM/NEW2 domain-containing protein n=1 Tax=Actinoplanes missouriensis TaxID=1866 RepID=UPI0034015461